MDSMVARTWTDEEKELLSFFEFAHLPPGLRDISAPFAQLARDLANNLPSSGQLTQGLMDLLRAKDCMVRAKLLFTDRSHA